VLPMLPSRITRTRSEPTDTDPSSHDLDQISRDIEHCRFWQAASQAKQHTASSAKKPQLRSWKEPSLYGIGQGSAARTDPERRSRIHPSATERCPSTHRQTEQATAMHAAEPEARGSATVAMSVCWQAWRTAPQDIEEERTRVQRLAEMRLTDTPGRRGGSDTGDWLRRKTP
jgi:hypothetical protein